MDDSLKIKRSMLCVFGVSLILFIPATLVWMVNLEIAAQSLNRGWSLFSHLLPNSLFVALSPFSADYSTVTTLVPMLIFLFPMIAALLVLRRLKSAEPQATVPWLPYPHRFGFFLVMLGLTGTLYGLLIGMNTSGVSSLTGDTAAEGISEALERLLDGTATALLSSLAGLAGAFIAAEPITWAFRRLACVADADEDVALSETLELLTNDLMELSKASREVRDMISPEKAQAFFGVLDRMDGSIGQMAIGVNNATDILKNIQGGQEEAGKSLQFLSRLEAIETATQSTAATSKAIDGSLDGLSNGLKQLDAQAGKSNELVSRLIEEIMNQGASQKEELSNILGALNQNHGDMNKDRAAIRKAFAAYGTSD